MLKEEIQNGYFSNINIWVDLGFVGLDKFLENVTILIPHKKSKNKPLTKEQKEENKVISKVRVKVENTIAMIKRYFILRIKNRMHTQSKLDDVVDLSANLWNFKKNS